MTRRGRGLRGRLQFAVTHITIQGAAPPVSDHAFYAVSCPNPAAGKEEAELAASHIYLGSFERWLAFRTMSSSFIYSGNGLGRATITFVIFGFCDERTVNNPRMVSILESGPEPRNLKAAK